MNPYKPESQVSTNEFPFAHELISVVDGLDGLKKLIEQYPDFHFCPYLADKTDDEWGVSTSRQYMNRVLPNFLYVPVNIRDGDNEMLLECVTYAQDNSSVTAVNITKPHKSAPVLKSFFYGDDGSTRNIDTLIKSNADGSLHPFDLNAPAFVNWFEEAVGPFAGRDVVIIGAGGVGEPLAKHIDAGNPASIRLVDVRDKSALAASLKSEASYHQRIEDILLENEGAIVINASGKDGISDDTGILEFIASSPKGTFADLRPQLQLEIVEKAKELGWSAYTGNGMNARNDYELLTGIMDYLRIAEEARPTFAEFEQKVAAAS